MRLCNGFFSASKPPINPVPTAARIEKNLSRNTTGSSSSDSTFDSTGCASISTSAGASFLARDTGLAEFGLEYEGDFADVGREAHCILSTCKKGCSAAGYDGGNPSGFIDEAEVGREEGCEVGETAIIGEEGENPLMSRPSLALPIPLLYCCLYHSSVVCFSRLITTISSIILSNILTPASLLQESILLSSSVRVSTG